MSSSPEIPPPLPAPPDAAIADLPLEKLSIEAENAMATALQLATDAQETYVETEHVVLGVVAEEGSLGALALQSLGVTRQFVTARVKPANPPANPPPARPIVGARLANALMQSMLRSTDTTVIDSGVLIDAVIAGNGHGRSDSGRSWDQS